jgi:4,5-dihydroxyphthalate decarboxylase
MARLSRDGAMSDRVPVTLACWDYDRTAALASGEVRPEGVDLTYLSLPVEETFFRMLRHREFDAAEMSLSSYVISLNDGQNAPFIAIPAFTSRAFRHNGIYVNAANGITVPQDLRGRTVGLAEYQLTANVWIRGILAEHYGVPVESVRYRTGGQHQPGRVAKVGHDLPPEIDIAPIPPDRTLADMLVTGEIDALYTPRTPLPFAQGRPEVRRLFADARAEEEHYFAETGIFPVMHVVVLRRDVYQARPWLAQSLFKAFEEARRRAAARLAETAASRDMLPWLYAEAERTRQLMGADYWSYGLAGNEAGLAAFLRYSHSHGLAHRLLDPVGLFAPETLESYVI